MKCNNQSYSTLKINNTLFSQHAFSDEEKERTLYNNIITDWYSGNHLYLQSLKLPGKAKELINKLEHLELKELTELAEQSKCESLLMTTIFLSGKCDANCEICYTDRKASTPSLDLIQLREVISQVSKLGNKTIYIPGEGEPFLDKNIFNLISLAKEYNQNVVIFTDGLLLSDEKRLMKTWGITLSELDKIICESPVYLYFKYWHSERNMFATMMRIHPDKYITEEIRLKSSTIVDVPSALSRLYKVAPEKIGIETAVHSLNYRDVISQIMTLVSELNIKWYLEPIIHSGRYFGRHEYDLSPEQYVQILPYLTKQQCKRTGFSATITTSGHLSFCPSFIPRLMINEVDRLNEICIIDSDGKVKDMFHLLHNNNFIVETRYKSFSHSCLCELFSTEKEEGKTSVANPAYGKSKCQNTT